MRQGTGRRGGAMRTGIIDLAGFLFRDGGSGKTAWGNKVLTAQAWGSEFKPQNPHTRQAGLRARL